MREDKEDSFSEVFEWFLDIKSNRDVIDSNNLEFVKSHASNWGIRDEYQSLGVVGESEGAMFESFTLCIIL